MTMTTPVVEDLRGPEGHFSAWLSSSFLLMTVSLLFYHMSRVHLEMSFRVAAFFSVALILIAVVLTVLALYTYYVRVTQLLNYEGLNSPSKPNEQQYKYVYLVVGILIILVELSLCVVIISGSVAKSRIPSRKN